YWIGINGKGSVASLLTIIDRTAGTQVTTKGVFVSLNVDSLRAHRLVTRYFDGSTTYTIALSKQYSFVKGHFYSIAIKLQVNLSAYAKTTRSRAGAAVDASFETGSKGTQVTSVMIA
ncbi:MAG TPA: hypothetical protein VMH90_01010, partial [Thermoplasmata archaeon]|nr:hypothetical protein [Thermoplasmata archaeon]